MKAPTSLDVRVIIPDPVAGDVRVAAQHEVGGLGVGLAPGEREGRFGRRQGIDARLNLVQPVARFDIEIPF